MVDLPRKVSVAFANVSIHDNSCRDQNWFQKSSKSISNTGLVDELMFKTPCVVIELNVPYGIIVYKYGIVKGGV